MLWTYIFSETDNLHESGNTYTLRTNRVEIPALPLVSFVILGSQTLKI